MEFSQEQDLTRFIALLPNRFQGRKHRKTASETEQQVMLVSLNLKLGIGWITHLHCVTSKDEVSPSFAHYTATILKLTLARADSQSHAWSFVGGSHCAVNSVHADSAADTQEGVTENRQPAWQDLPPDRERPVVH